MKINYLFSANLTLFKAADTESHSEILLWKSLRLSLKNVLHNRNILSISHVVTGAREKTTIQTCIEILLYFTFNSITCVNVSAILWIRINNCLKQNSSLISESISFFLYFLCSFPCFIHFNCHCSYLTSIKWDTYQTY